MRFIDGYKAVLLRVLANAGKPLTDSINNDLVTARALGVEQPERMAQAIEQLAAEGSPIEPAVQAAIRSLRLERWIYLRHGKTFAVFLDFNAHHGYAVKALTTPFNVLIDDEPPIVFEAGLLAFEGQFICDGLALGPVKLGPGYRAQLNAAYAGIRKAGRFHAKAAG